MPSRQEIEAAAKAAHERGFRVKWAGPDGFTYTDSPSWGRLSTETQDWYRGMAEAALTAAEGERHPHDSQVADLLRSLARQGRNGKVPDSGTLEYAEKMAKVITEREARTQGDPIKELGELQRERNEELRTEIEARTQPDSEWKAKAGRFRNTGEVTSMTIEARTQPFPMGRRGNYVVSRPEPPKPEPAQPIPDEAVEAGCRAAEAFENAAVAASHEADAAPSLEEVVAVAVKAALPHLEVAWQQQQTEAELADPDRHLTIEQSFVKTVRASVLAEVREKVEGCLDPAGRMFSRKEMEAEIRRALTAIQGAGDE